MRIAVASGKGGTGKTTEVSILIPEVYESRCTFFGCCAEVCQFHAIAVIGARPRL